MNNATFIPYQRPEMKDWTIAHMFPFRVSSLRR